MHFESNILLAIFAQIFLQTHDGEVWFLATCKYLFVGEQVSGVVSTLSQLVGESESETKPIKCGTKPLQSNKHRAGPVKPPQTPQWTDRAKCQLRRDLICEGKKQGDTCTTEVEGGITQQLIGNATCLHPEWFLAGYKRIALFLMSMKLTVRQDWRCLLHQYHF